MHLNYYFLKRLSQQLNSKLIHSQLIECFSQEKDELVLGFILKNGNEFFIKATLQSDFTSLSFPEKFARSRRNNIDLFPSIVGKKVESVHQYLNERAFHIGFENGPILLFKMHGNRSNLLLVEGENRILFKKKLVKDQSLELEQLERPIEKSLDLYLNNPDYTTFYPTFGKRVKLYLRNHGFDKMEIHQQWQFLQELVSQLETNPIFLSQIDGVPALSLLQFGNEPPFSNDPIEALNKFYRVFKYDFAFEKEKNAALNFIEKKIKQAKAYSAKTSQQLKRIETETPPNQLADILMANLHNIAPGVSKAKLFNFYNESEIEIKLNKALSPQKNAENYYRKGKNRKIEIEKLTENILSKEQQLEELDEEKLKVESTQDLKSLRALLKSNALFAEKDKPTEHMPYKAFVVEGYQVWVGKNAKANDELSLKHSYKEDLWLHAKDVPGSHVLIKHQAGKAIPSSVIERAAELAAYYSKRKTDTLVPVIYTPSKYIRKRKGALPGQVVVEKEKVMMVPSRGPQNLP